MTKDELISELIKLREDIISDLYDSFSRRDLQQKVEQRFEKLLKKSVQSGPVNCENCSIKKEYEDLAQIINKTYNKHFKTSSIEQEVKDDNNERT